MIFRKDGNVDFVNASRDFYSTRNIDFRKQKYVEDPKTIKDNYFICDVFISGKYLYLVASKDKENPKTD